VDDFDFREMFSAVAASRERVSGRVADADALEPAIEVG